MGPMAFESTEALDEIDWKLVEALQEDGRAGYADLGRRLSLSAPAIAERVRRLEADGVIRGYHALVDPAKLGFGMHAVIRMVISNGHETALIADRLKEAPEVVECHRVTGSDSYVLRAVVRSVEHLDELLVRIMPHSGDTITAIVLSSPVEHRTITRQTAPRQLAG